MAQLVVRGLEKEVVQALKVRAAEHGHSAEEEHRDILKKHLLEGQPAKRSFKEILAAMPYYPEDEDLFDVR